MAPIVDVTKTVLTQFLVPVVAAVIGGWIGVQITLATLTTELDNLVKRVDKVEVRSEADLRESNEFRERIVRLETLQEIGVNRVPPR